MWAFALSNQTELGSLILGLVKIQLPTQRDQSKF